MHVWYLTAFLERQGISVIPICQKIIWVWTACWMLHEKLPWLWFSSSSQCSLHAPRCASGPGSKFITLAFWISAYCLHTNALFAASIPTAFKTWGNSAEMQLTPPSAVAWVRFLCAVACFAMGSQQHQGTPLNLLPTPGHQQSSGSVWDFSREWCRLTTATCCALHGWETRPKYGPWS